MNGLLLMPQLSGWRAPIGSTPSSSALNRMFVPWSLLLLWAVLAPFSPSQARPATSEQGRTSPPSLSLSLSLYFIPFLSLYFLLSCSFTLSLSFPITCSLSLCLLSCLPPFLNVCCSHRSLMWFLGVLIVIFNHFTY